MPDRIAIGKSNPRKEYVDELGRAWRKRRLAIFLGTGVSLEYGVPNWRDLVMDLLLMTNDRFDRFLPEYRTALANWMSSYYDFNLLTLSRVVKYKLRKKSENGETGAAFATMIHRALYRVWHSEAYAGLRQKPHRPTTLGTLARLIASGSAGGGPVALVTMNFDDFLEQELGRAGVAHHSVADGCMARGTGLPVVHPHGFLPELRGAAAADLVFSEDEYHRLAHSPFHWAVGEMLNYLRRYTVLFVGLSMSDPTLRRLLDETVPRDTKGKPIKPYRRFVVRQDYAPPGSQEKSAVVGQIEAGARRRRELLGVETIRKTDGDIMDAVRRMAVQAHTFDRELFRDMGTGVVWLKGYEDLPVLLKTIAGG